MGKKNDFLQNFHIVRPINNSSHNFYFRAKFIFLIIFNSIKCDIQIQGQNLYGECSKHNGISPSLRENRVNIFQKPHSHC